jgi:hypothetical protein
MASRVANPFGAATSIGDGLSSVFGAFLQAPTQEERAANALKIHSMQADARRALAGADYDVARTEGQTIANDAMRALPTLDFAAPDAQGRVMQTMNGNYGSLADVFATHQALSGKTPRDMDAIVYAKTGNAPNTFAGMDITDATTRRGQDVTAATTRRGQDLTHSAAIYGHDRSYQASTENNAADNVRALIERDLIEKGLDRRSAAELAQKTLDRMLQESGSMERTIADNARALQTNAADNTRAIQVEQMQQDGQDRRFSVNTPANTITTVPSTSPIATSPTGNTTIEGIRTSTGMGGRGSNTPKNYRTPDNQTGITYDGLTDAVTNQPLPQGTQLAGTVSANGFTEAQTKDAAWAVRLDNGLNNWKDLSASFDPTSAKDFLVQDARIPWTDLNIGNAMISPERQRFQQAAREILAVALRKDTGAAITPDEVVYYGPMLLPMPFDDQTTLNQKVASLNNLRATLIAGGGPAYDEAQRLLSNSNFAIDVPFAGGAAAPSATPQPGQAYVPPQGAAAPAVGPTPADIAEAQAAINAGKDPAAVRARFKQHFGADLP